MIASELLIHPKKGHPYIAFRDPLFFIAPFLFVGNEKK